MIQTIKNIVPRKSGEVEKSKAYVSCGPNLLNDTNNLSPMGLYMGRFNMVPDSIEEVDIDCGKAIEWFVDTYRDDIWDTHFSTRFVRRSGKNSFDEVYYFLFEDLLVFFDAGLERVRLLFRKTEHSRVVMIVQEIQKWRLRKKRSPEILVIVTGRSGLDVHPLELKKSNLDVNANYNDDFEEIHGIIVQRLKKKNDKGLVILHGKPGTGKTSYVRYLPLLVKKDIIFMPPHMATMITNPDLLNLLMRNPNSILIIEDAENIVIDRETDGRSPVSALLNISDGLLSDCLNIQIICSFNTDISKVDKALLRKGRLIANYEFKELALDKARRLSEKLGFQSEIDKPMTLAEIYNQNDKSFLVSPQRRLIGFGTGH